MSLRLNVVSGARVTQEVVVSPGSPVVAGSYGMSYIALGDSYSSGEGAPGNYEAGTDGDSEYPEEKCHVSTRAYSYNLASEYLLSSSSNDGDFRLVACSGSKTSDVDAALDGYIGLYEQLYPEKEVLTGVRSDALQNFIPGRVPQQGFLDYYRPTIATIGIGGNDVDFGGVVGACALPITTCAYATTERDAVGDNIKNLYSVLLKTYRSVAKQSPDTRIFAIGYPHIVTDASRCTVNLSGFDGKERRLVRESTMYLNKVIKAAAERVGITYIDIEDSLGYGALCGTSLAMNGIKFAFDGDISVGT